MSQINPVKFGDFAFYSHCARCAGHAGNIECYFHRTPSKSPICKILVDIIGERHKTRGSVSTDTMTSDEWLVARIADKRSNMVAWKEFIHPPSLIRYIRY